MGQENTNSFGGPFSGPAGDLLYQVTELFFHSEAPALRLPDDQSSVSKLFGAPAGDALWMSSSVEISPLEAPGFLWRKHRISLVNPSPRVLQRRISPSPTSLPP
ncbi:hypothetical protein RCIX1097 [Methanocella arvoryzae MRE50]|uniref:Uncharacterized protein n=1 Tax=Methanocella arvoryzae (strain DSM 22066 / NBRC 105507 / MRE50) TaxID=351160 RepID=Q0W5C9_METAR|nr:hypothetical protein RCIX1097 [Methanocella arvoryzae MRE50]